MKHRNVDIYLNELKKEVALRKSQKKPIDKQDKGISEARQRQNRFLMGEYESKAKQLKAQN